MLFLRPSRTYDIHVVVYRNRLHDKRREAIEETARANAGYRTNPNFEQRPLLHASRHFKMWDYIGHRMQVERLLTDRS